MAWGEAGSTRDYKPTPNGQSLIEYLKLPPSFSVPVSEGGISVVDVEDVVNGHIRAMEVGDVGERYILGGENMSLREILAVIAAIVGRPAPRWRLPHALLLPVAYGAEAWSRASGREPLLTVDGLRLARKHMYFTSARAEHELGYRARPARDALEAAVAGFRELGYL